MNPDPAVTSALDYIIEIFDDGNEAAPRETDVIIIPPPSQTKKQSSAQDNPPEKRT
jgi:hypothetical protein